MVFDLYSVFCQIILNVKQSFIHTLLIDFVAHYEIDKAIVLQPGLNKFMIFLNKKNQIFLIYLFYKSGI